MVVNCDASTLRFPGTNGQDANIPWEPTREQETTKRIAENGGIGSHASRRSSREVDNAVEMPTGYRFVHFLLLELTRVAYVQGADGEREGTSMIPEVESV